MSYDEEQSVFTVLSRLSNLSRSTALAWESHGLFIICENGFIFQGFWRSLFALEWTDPACSTLDRKPIWGTRTTARRSARITLASTDPHAGNIVLLRTEARHRRK